MLMPDGSVSGYSHDNEASWGFEGNDLTLYARNGAPSTRFTTRSERNGLPVLSGVLLLDRSIRHILSQVEDDIVGKTWQFWRRTNDTVLRSPLRLRADGTFDGPTHPNESRWAVADGRLTFYDANGTPSTRFEPPLMTNGRAEYTGQFLFDADITHVLSEIDLEVIGKVWRFWRIVTGVPDTVIDDKVRLLPNHGVDGHRHSQRDPLGHGRERRCLLRCGRVGDDPVHHNAQQGFGNGLRGHLRTGPGDHPSARGTRRRLPVRRRLRLVAGARPVVRTSADSSVTEAR